MSQRSTDPSLNQQGSTSSAPGILLNGDWLMGAGPRLIMIFDWPLTILDQDPGLWTSPSGLSIDCHALHTVLGDKGLAAKC